MAQNTYVQAVNGLLKNFSKESYFTDKNDNTYAHTKMFSDIIYAVTHNANWVADKLSKYDKIIDKMITVDRNEVGAEDYACEIADEVRILKAQVVEYDLIAKELKDHLKTEYEYNYDVERKRSGRSKVPKGDKGQRKDITLNSLKELKKR